MPELETKHFDPSLEAIKGIKAQHQAQESKRLALQRLVRLDR